jgi:response regulator RpfG family c-di-GMP phosphodiesterase
MNQPNKPPILLVDDEPEMLFSLKGLLRREFELYTAESGAEAMEILGQHEIHVVMTDQRMPEMSGVQLVRRVKNEYPEAIRIVFTGYADIKSVVEAINKGGLWRYITKPWDPDELVDVLHEAAAEYQKIIRGKRLLAEMREYLKQAQELIRAVREEDTAGRIAAVDLDGLSEKGRSLLEQLSNTNEPPPGTAEDI